MTFNIISNFAANVALRNLHVNGDLATKSVAKLSSGSRVVSAADDAASYAIGTRLNLEVKSLGQAQVNAGQATSLLQVADGTLARIQDVLTRAKVLAVQAGSQNLSNTERALLDTEFQNLVAEIDRLAKDTEFSGAKLMVNGSSESVSQIGGFLIENGTMGAINVSARGFRNRGVTDGGDGGFTISVTAGSAGTTGSELVVFSSIARAATGSVAFTATINTDLIANAGNTLTGDLTTGTTLLFTRDTRINSSFTALTSFTQTNAQVAVSLDERFNVASLFVAATTSTGSFTILNNTSGPSHDFTFKVGSGILPSEDNIAISVQGLTVENLGLSNANITTYARADSASQAISQALDFLVKVRSDVGAATNRLDFASQNIATAIESQEAARSRLLDLDVAAEITYFTNKQILVQAGISVLAQANALPQNVLRLFA